MKIRLHEIEFGTTDVKETSSFFQSLLGLQPRVKQEGLTVFDAGVKAIDVNFSVHFPPGIAAISFLTDDLDEIKNRLNAAGISYQGPVDSHLGMRCLQFTSPDGYIIKVSTPGPKSPDWLEV